MEIFITFLPIKHGTLRENLSDGAYLTENYTFCMTDISKALSMTGKIKFNFTD